MLKYYSVINDLNNVVARPGERGSSGFRVSFCLHVDHVPCDITGNTIL